MKQTNPHSGNSQRSAQRDLFGFAIACLRSDRTILRAFGVVPENSSCGNPVLKHSAMMGNKLRGIASGLMALAPVVCYGLSAWGFLFLTTLLLEARQIRTG